MTFVFVFIFLCAFCITDFMKKSGFILFNRFFIILLLTFFCGLRGTYVGADYINYMEIFQQVPTLDSLSKGYNEIHGELLYLFINSIIKTFTFDSVFIFLFIAFLTALINIYNFNKYSHFFILSVLLYFSHFYLNKDFIQIRTALSSAILYFTIPYILNKKFFKFSIVVGIASLIHSAAIVMFFVYFYSFIEFSKKRVFIILAITIILSFTNWLHLILEILTNYNILPYSVSLYIGSEYDYPLGLSNPITIKQIIILSFFTIYYNFYNKLKYFKIMYNMYFLSTIWIILFSEFAIIAARVASFMSIVEVIILPMLILKFRYKKTIYILLVLFAFLVLYINIFFREVVGNYYFIEGFL